MSDSDVPLQHECWTLQIFNLKITNKELFVKNVLLIGDVSKLRQNLCVITDTPAAMQAYVWST
jgi:hypothetical protein